MFQNFLSNGITNSKWQSYHLFTEQKLDEVIVQVLLPFVDFFYYEKKIIDQFFFIRYWEEGTHIRIRFKLSNNLKEDQTIEKIIIFIENQLDYYLAIKKKQNKVYIKQAEYVPEYSRYGGKMGILLAEEFFQLSSLTVLSMMKSGGLTSTSSKIAAAIQMHWIFNKIFLMNYCYPIENIYSKVFTNWLPKLIGDKITLRSELQDLIKKFEKSYLRQEKEIISMLLAIDIELLDNTNAFEWLTFWKNGLDNLTSQFHNLISEDCNPYSSMHKKEYLEHMLGSYIHMTNNRIGISNIDESFIGFIILRAINKTKI